MLLQIVRLSNNCVSGCQAAAPGAKRKTWLVHQRWCCWWSGLRLFVFKVEEGLDVQWICRPGIWVLRLLPDYFSLILVFSTWLVGWLVRWRLIWKWLLTWCWRSGLWMTCQRHWGRNGVVISILKLNEVEEPLRLKSMCRTGILGGGISKHFHYFPRVALFSIKQIEWKM